MKKGIRETEAEWKQRPERTVGIDLGDDSAATVY